MDYEFVWLLLERQVLEFRILEPEQFGDNKYMEEGHWNRLKVKGIDNIKTASPPPQQNNK